MISKIQSYRYCRKYKEVENYEKAVNDPTQKWVIHHRLETHFSDGTPRPVNAFISTKELIALGMYFKRPPEELIFMPNHEHCVLHNKGVVKTLSEEGRLKRIEASKKLKGRPAWNKGKKCPQISKANKGRKLSDEHRKQISKTTRKLLEDRKNKGLDHWNKGRPKTEDLKLKQSKAIKGRHWYNNGVITVMSFTCPEGFKPGRLSFREPRSDRD